MITSQLRVCFGLLMCLLALVVPGLAQDKSAPGPQGKSKAEETLIRIEYQLKDQKITVGETVVIRLKLLDKSTGDPKNDLKDARALVFLAPGIYGRPCRTCFERPSMFPADYLGERNSDSGGRICHKVWPVG